MRILPPPMSLGRANSEGEDDCQEAAPVPAADTDQDMSTAQAELPGKARETSGTYSGGMSTSSLICMKLHSQSSLS